MSDFEGQHPRGPGGKFAPKGGGVATAAKRIGERDQDKSTAALSRLKTAKEAVAQGGATVEPSTGGSVKTGFAVATYRGHEHVVDVNGLEGPALEQKLSSELNHYLSSKSHVFAADKNAKLGMWYDNKNKKWFFDVSSVVHSEHEARQLGLKHDQIAIYDLKQGREIRLGGRLK